MCSGYYRGPDYFKKSYINVCDDNKRLCGDIFLCLYNFFVYF